MRSINTHEKDIREQNIHEKDIREKNIHEKNIHEKDIRERNIHEKNIHEKNTHEKNTHENRNSLLKKREQWATTTSPTHVELILSLVQIVPWLTRPKLELPPL